MAFREKNCRATPAARGLRVSRYYAQKTGSCATPEGAYGTVKIAKGVATLGLPDQNSWAQIRTTAYPQGLTLSDLQTLKFDSKASDAGVVWAKITTTDNHTVVFSPNTQPGGEQGVRSWSTHNVMAGTVRLDDDGGNYPDTSWDQVRDAVGASQIEDVRVTAGCANPVGGGAEAQVDNLTINDKVIRFN